MDVAVWLRGLGLERYEAAFRDNEIDWEALPKLTSEDLKDLGVVLGGHRRKLLDAIAALRDQPEAAAERNVLRSSGFDPAVIAARSRGSARGHRRLSSHCRRCRQQLRRVCCEIHGR